MTNPVQPGPELVDIIIESDGTVTNVWSDGDESQIAAGPGAMKRQRARGIATQSFLKRKRRPWPTPRI